MMFAGRVDVMNVRDGLVVKRTVYSDSKIAPGVFEFITEQAEINVPRPKEVDVIGIAYGSPGVYVGTVEDMDTGEKASAMVIFERDPELKMEIINVSAKKLERASVYFVAHGIYKDILYSPDLEPNHKVAFWGVALAR
ncbi:hypothetical protein [Thermococcus chitonophagus]|uniref:Uncharacterized protein n=2 Tax=Thermococcus chitonophagus TaxID=54262 RepID=A0A170STU1_9EURY|nr:hypothetical protein [Thermococcus chitonophagus]CUX78705.1 hypothetical protein CHITON_1926 [Thermococcus chitonophagus]